MKSLHIRDVNPIVLSRLEGLAKLHHRSVQGEVRALLEEAVKRLPVQDAEALDGLVMAAAEPQGDYDRESLYADDAR
jgi:plasmid stability protein